MGNNYQQFNDVNTNKYYGNQIVNNNMNNNSMNQFN
jgi:hypothetical protein